MRARRVATLVVVLLFWPARAPRAENLRLTLLSARINPRKIKPHDHPASTAALSDLACLSLPGLRQMAGACGGAEPEEMARRPRVSPLLRVEVGDRVIRTYPVPGTLNPSWQYGAILDGAFLRGAKNADFILYDYHGPGQEQMLAGKRVKARDLLRPGTQKLKLGAAELTYSVEPIPEDQPPRTYHFQVPANQQMADLARNASTGGPGYVVIPVAEGEIVAITASGKVRPSKRKHPDRSAGPNGVPTQTTKIQYNQPGFRGCPGCNHAALIAQLGPAGMVIGDKKQFTAESSGLLVLAINDLKVSDNDGGFDVKAAVSLPPATAAPHPPARERGGPGDRGPAALDPRVVQQTIDAHGADLDACAQGERDPYGEVVLLFSISADGSPLGVVVEKASPNLRQAGECMRKKALRWKFPPPRGVVSARYPISFSPS